MLDLRTVPGCLMALVLIFGGLYLLAWLLFCVGGRCAARGDAVNYLLISTADEPILRDLPRVRFRRAGH